MLKGVLALLFTSYIATAVSASKKVTEKVMPQDIISYVPHHPMVDNSTFANIDEIVVSHQHVDWYVNWTNKTLQGSIIMDLTVVSDVMYISLDTWGNVIEDV